MNEEKFSVSMGNAISAGIVKGVWAAVVWIVGATIVLQLLYNGLGLFVDDSDRAPWRRSGMTVRTDAKTGRQYLESKSGCLTPRLDENGTQIVVKVLGGGE